MASEHEIILAFLFKRTGKQRPSYSELYLDLSMNLNWFSPEDAKKFLNDAIKKKLLIKEGESVSASFEINKIEIPMGFTPSKKIFFEKKRQKDLDEKNTFGKIVKRICDKTNLGENEVINKINAISKEKNLLIEIGALLVGKDYDLDLSDFFEEIDEKIF